MGGRGGGALHPRAAAGGVRLLGGAGGCRRRPSPAIAFFVTPDLIRGPAFCPLRLQPDLAQRSEEHTSALQSLMRISYAVFCLKQNIIYIHEHQTTKPHNL